MVTPDRPVVFIASTREGADIAKAIQTVLSDACHVTLWLQSFELSSHTLDSLEEAATNADFAIVVLTGDDIVRSRGNTQQSPRDNLLFELGLFIGKLGRRRAFIVVDQSAAPKIPSDLSGITFRVARRKRRARENQPQAVSQALQCIDDERGVPSVSV